MGRVYFWPKRIGRKATRLQGYKATSLSGCKVLEVVMRKECYLGLDSSHLVALQRQDGGPEVLALDSALKAFKALKADAQRHGFELEICSGYRSFERQSLLFSNKFLGKRPILDRNEQPITQPIADPVERMQAILVFSSMPGFSRHHFGSDFDIYAPNKLPEHQSLQLTYHEYLPGSYFYELGQYLKETLARFEFANPYASQKIDADSGQSHSPVQSLAQVQPLAQTPSQAQTQAQDQVNTHQAQPQSQPASTLQNATAPQVGFEPWHISHLPSARPYLAEYDPQVALDYVCQQDLPFAPWVRKVMTPEQIAAMLRFDIC